MKLIIDDAHMDLIKKIYEYYPIDGVTTNPSILAKSGRKPYEVLKEIREFIGTDAELHVQVVAKDAHGMVEDAHRIVKELGKNTFVNSWQLRTFKQQQPQFILRCRPFLQENVGQLMQHRISTVSTIWDMMESK